MMFIGHTIKRTWLTFLVFLISVLIVMAAKGVVVLKKSVCDYLIIEKTEGFALLEW